MSDPVMSLSAQELRALAQRIQPYLDFVLRQALERIVESCEMRRSMLDPGTHRGDLALIQMIAEDALKIDAR